MTAFVFPGQGSQYSGMGKDLFENSTAAQSIFEHADDILEFPISQTMFEGSDEELAQTDVTQPAIFIHSVAAARTIDDKSPAMVAGHSLGEFSALVAAQAMSFEDGLKLVHKRAQAMQKACEMAPSTMAAVLGLDDFTVEEVLATITEETVVAANYNCPGQVVISGSERGIELACEKMTEAGAKRARKLNVGGGFHSPFMDPAKEELEQAIIKTHIYEPACPIYQNVTGQPSRDIDTIKNNLIAQLTSPVKWTQTIQNMTADGTTHFVECGPGKVLQGLVKKIDRNATIEGVS